MCSASWVCGQGRRLPFTQMTFLCRNFWRQGVVNMGIFPGVGTRFFLNFCEVRHRRRRLAGWLSWLSCLVLSCRVLSCLGLSCLVLSCLVLSWLAALPFHALPCLVWLAGCLPAQTQTLPRLVAGLHHPSSSPPRLETQSPPFVFDTFVFVTDLRVLSKSACSSWFQYMMICEVSNSKIEY